MGKRHKVRVLYKSGNSIEFECDDLNIEWDRSDNRVTSMTWKDPKPKPLMVGIHNIEAVYEL
jgi:hypothetical protein